MQEAVDGFLGRRSAETISRRAFVRDEDGGMIVWSLYIMLGILMAVGLGIDVMRTENLRTHMQNTLDRAVLAAADLEQERTPQQVVDDYFTRADIPANAVDLDPNFGNLETEKIVNAEISAKLGTVLLDIIGRDTLPAFASGEAREAITDVEISLVLDNSGSMGWDNDFRLNLLKPAAKEFIDTVMRPREDGSPSTASVSIVPFSTQVNAGPVLGDALNFSSEHGYSQCAEFPDSSFDSVAMNPATQLRRGGHFDIFTWDAPVKPKGLICPTEASRTISAFSQDAEALKTQIDAMWARGNTSIDIAAKWGAALLDPAFRTVVDDMVTDEVLPIEVSGRPFDYGRPNTLKVLVVMSDGQNTQEHQLRDAYRSGLSPVFRNPETNVVSYFDADRGEYFVFNAADVKSNPGGQWEAEPSGGDAAERLKWPDVWNSWSVAVFARDIKSKAVGGNWNSHYNAVYKSTNPNDKDDRAKRICKAARDAGIVVYTVGMDTYGKGDEVLSACAGSEVNFFDVEAKDIGLAFSAIASQINQLRLTQ